MNKEYFFMIGFDNTAVGIFFIIIASLYLGVAWGDKGDK